MIASVPILLDSTRSTEILSWKKIFERVESSKIQKWHSLDSLEFSLLCFERVPSTRRVFLKEHCNFYASTENVLPYCVQHKLESESGDPSKKLNPEHLEYDYERLIFFFEKLKLIKIFYASIILKRKGRTTKQTFYLCHIVSIYKSVKSWTWVLQSQIL